MSNDSLPQIVSQAAQARGFHLAGIAPVFHEGDGDRAGEEFVPPELAHFPQWVAEGRAGEMEYLKRRDAEGRFLRSSVRIPFPWVRSVVVCAVNYNNDQPYSIDAAPQQSVGNPAWIARYAWSGQRQEGPPGPGAAVGGVQDDASVPLDPTDYHLVMRTRLEQLRADLAERLGEFQARCFVDTGPLIERIYAKYAGLGWQGKNTCLINQSIGSWFFLGVILTSIEVPRTQSAPLMPDRCGSCTRCIDACPTDALEPYRLDASRCIAYLTIEKRGEIPEELAALVGRNVFGCDICQEVCPWNNRRDGEGRRQVPLTDWPELQPRTELVNPALDWLAAIGEQDYRRLFRRSSLERAKYAGFARNILNARKNAQEGGAPTS